MGGSIKRSCRSYFLQIILFHILLPELGTSLYPSRGHRDTILTCNLLDVNNYYYYRSCETCALENLQSICSKFALKRLQFHFNTVRLSSTPTL